MPVARPDTYGRAMPISSRRLIAIITAVLLLGIGIGIAGTVGIAAVSEELNTSPFGGTEPGATRWHCDGAVAIAVATLDDGIVHVHIPLTDDEQRRWELKPSAYYPRADLTPNGDGSYPVMNVPDGDRDGGSTRYVSLRVVDTEKWCTARVSLVEPQAN